MKKPTVILSRALSLLEAQRQALLSGDILRLDQLADELERVFRGLSVAGVPAAMLAPVADAARRNAALLDAAQRGVAQARASLDHGKAASLTTYDRHGRAHGTAAPEGRLLSRR